MLTFEPVTEEEVLNLLKAGVYDFEVVFAEDVTSKRTGNPMIKLTLKVYGEDGRAQTINDYLMPALMYKLKHFCDTAGLEDKFTKGTLAADDCKNASGKCKVKIEESEGYSPKNAIQDYVKETKVKASQSKLVTPAADFVDDDLPF